MPQANERVDSEDQRLPGSPASAESDFGEWEDDEPFTLEDLNRMRANGLTLEDAIAAIEARHS